MANVEVVKGRKGPDDLFVKLLTQYPSYEDIGIMLGFLFRSEQQYKYGEGAGYLKRCIDEVFERREEIYKLRGLPDDLMKKYSIGPYKPKKLVKTGRFNSKANVSNTMTEFVTIVQAAKMRSGIDTAGEITKIGETRTVNLKNGGTADVADATLSDDSGDVALALWGDDIKLATLGKRVTILNGYTNEFKGQVSLTKGKFGTLEVQ